MPDTKPYRGRFAPSPSGPLHFGSLVTALGSYLQARSQQGEWLVRMEDIDPPREQPGAADAILRALEAYHLHWDGPVLYQSSRHDAYEAALAQLDVDHFSFACGCSRKSIAAASNGDAQTYPGTCRNGLPAGVAPRAIRVRVNDRRQSFIDALQGPLESHLQTDVGDFVVRRADGLYAYHLAVVVDDAEQEISEIVRGTDLLSATPPQRYLQQCLGYQHPRYAHLPIAVNQQGQKLSKQTFAQAIDTRHPGPTLVKALGFLGHPPDAELHDAGPELLLQWATAQWELQNVPHTAAICSETDTN
jgi:glutamyl-Q tRNA(Asp) synthetase